mmetsp:Transcript_26170/g.63071  ORF Transcript_26170/g.63071 Transcript_26170/m.63071 type:complete len:174 (+) Transcript_26170:771-1292(+)
MSEKSSFGIDDKESCVCGSKNSRLGSPMSLLASVSVARDSGDEDFDAPSGVAASEELATVKADPVHSSAEIMPRRLNLASRWRRRVAASRVCVKLFLTEAKRQSTLLDCIPIFAFLINFFVAGFSSFRNGFDGWSPEAQEGSMTTNRQSPKGNMEQDFLPKPGALVHILLRGH